jgi:hypothetical protein
MLVAHSIEGEKCIQFILFLRPQHLSVMVCINPLCRYEEALKKTVLLCVHSACEFNDNFQCAFKSLIEWTELQLLCSQMNTPDRQKEMVVPLFSQACM